MIAAARRPDATRSLTLLEAAATALPGEPPAWRALVDDIAAMWGSEAPDREWVVQFLTAVGSDPTEFPDEFLDVAESFTPVFRNGRPFHHADLPFTALAAAPFPKLVVSGGHSAAFDAICDDLGERIGASRSVVKGAGHEIQFAGPPLNEALMAPWRTASLPSASSLR